MTTERFETVSCPGGTGHYINDHRCGGSKPLGGGEVTYSAKLNAKDILAALAGSASGRKALKEYVNSKSLATLPASEAVAIVDISVPHMRTFHARMHPDAEVPPVDTLLYTRAQPQADAAPVLHHKTSDLVARFARALAEKLAAAEVKYGYTDGWLSPDWMDECRAKLLEHVAKGDPRDVAAYCAFLWHHNASTAMPQADVAELVALGDEERQQLADTIDQFVDTGETMTEYPVLLGQAAQPAAGVHALRAHGSRTTGRSTGTGWRGGA